MIIRTSAAIIGLSMLLTVPAQAAKSCVMAGGEATMVTKDLAVFMANAALTNSMKAKGLTAQGKAKVTCKDPSPLTYCIAQQKACK